MKFFDRFKKTELATPAVSSNTTADNSENSITNTPVKEQKKPKATPKKTAKELATEKGEPYIAVLSVDLDPDNIGSGAFELDWNDKFIINLVRAGYQVKPNEPENDIVDRWFRAVCQNVVLETYEQDMADPDKRTAATRRELDSGRAEFS